MAAERPGVLLYHEDLEILRTLDRETMTECFLCLIDFSINLEKTGEISSCHVENALAQVMVNRMTEKILRDSEQYRETVRTNTINSRTKTLGITAKNLGAKLSRSECYRLATVWVDEQLGMTAEEIVRDAKELLPTDNRPDTDRTPTDDRAIPNYNVTETKRNGNETKPETEPTSLQTYPNPVNIPQTEQDKLRQLIAKAEKNGVEVSERVAVFLADRMRENTFEYVAEQLEKTSFRDYLKAMK